MAALDVIRPAVEAGHFEATAEWAGTRSKNSADDFREQGVIGACFSEIVRNSTPADLLLMAALHRQYAPQEPLPSELQRAIGAAWAARGGRERGVQ